MYLRMFLTFQCILSIYGTHVRYVRVPGAGVLGKFYYHWELGNAFKKLWKMNKPLMLACLWSLVTRLEQKSNHCRNIIDGNMTHREADTGQRSPRPLVGSRLAPSTTEGNHSTPGAHIKCPTDGKDRTPRVFYLVHALFLSNWTLKEVCCIPIMEDKDITNTMYIMSSPVCTDPVSHSFTTLCLPRDNSSK